jgi:hypothetical protein
VLTPPACLAGRDLLRWSIGKLALRSGVDDDTLRQFEARYGVTLTKDAEDGVIEAFHRFAVVVGEGTTGARKARVHVSGSVIDQGYASIEVGNGRHGWRQEADEVAAAAPMWDWKAEFDT